MEKLSVVIIAFNEERDIAWCLESVRAIADEVLVLDSFSTDRTEAICRKFGARFEQHRFDGYVSQKNRALQMASNDLVLSLDADEALSEEARIAILAIKKNREHDGFYFKRLNSWCGHQMRHTSWYPDRKLRLFDRSRAGWTGIDPHDEVMMEHGSRLFRLDAGILHRTVHSLAEHREKTESAQFYFDRQIKSGWGSALTHSAWRWFREYCVLLGFLDGKAGWQVARFSAIYVWKKYSYLRKLYGNRR
jgi:glycosyltransferase involved in cell wall biosynthesis